MDESTSNFGILVLALAAISVAFSIWSNRSGDPLVSIANRWFRWGLVAIGTAYAARYLGGSARPLWALSAMAFLGWFLLETLYNWVLIKAISRSDMPLFPKFRSNDGGDEWPADVKSIRARDWLRRERFKKRQSLKAELFEGSELRSTVYDSEDATIRLQILFIPRPQSAFTLCGIFSSQLENGNRVVTDNIFMPFGGFYPEDWDLQRRPLRRSLQRLHRMHLLRIRREGLELVPWDPQDDPVDEINAQQQVMEKVNTERGFLFPRYLQEERGKFTETGRYRVWLEIWLLNYLGITVSTKS